MNRMSKLLHSEFVVRDSLFLNSPVGHGGFSRQEAACIVRISDLGMRISKKQKTEVLLWERLLAAILRFDRFQHFERIN